MACSATNSNPDVPKAIAAYTEALKAADIKAAITAVDTQFPQIASAHVSEKVLNALKEKKVSPIALSCAHMWAAREHIPKQEAMQKLIGELVGTDGLCTEMDLAVLARQSCCLTGAIVDNKRKNLSLAGCL